MDGQRFDAIARGFAARLTRRRAVAGALGLAVAAIGAGDATAAVRPTCRAYGAGCNRSSQCCDGRCDTRRTTPRSRRNRCTCPEDLARCGRVCADLQTNVLHCGACGNACEAAEICQSGVCICLGELGTDEHCSACGDACGANQKCCGARGCVDLGTETDCLDCNDTCDETSNDYLQREFCNGDQGCQQPCRAAGYGGFVSVDWPPVIFSAPEGGGIDNDFAGYVDPTNSIPGVQYASCTSSADCSDCPATIGAGLAIVGCGCMSVRCGVGGSVDFSLINRASPDPIPYDTAVCWAHYVV